jgi:hypothetical protein
MKKLILFLLILSVFSTCKAYAMGSPQDTNPNAPNYYPPPKPTAAPTSPKTTTTTTTTSTCTNVKGCGPAPAKTAAFTKSTGAGFTKDFGLMYQMQNSIAKAGPQVASNLANISGQLFAYLAVISLILWSIQNLMFGDKGVKEFFLYFFFLMIVRGLLAGYNFFFEEGVVQFFASLGALVGGTTSPMGTFGNVFQIIYIDIGRMDVQGGGLLAPLLYLLTVTIDQIFLIAMGLVVLGTIVLVQVYIAIALITGYIFVPFMIFKPLEFLWNGWLKFLITSALSYFLIFAISALLGDTVTQLVTYNGANMSSGEVMGLLLILGIFAYLFLKIPAIAGEIVSGMPNMSFSGVTSVVIGAASVMLAGGRIAGMAAKTGSQIMNKAKGKE